MVTVASKGKGLKKFHGQVRRAALSSLKNLKKGHFLVNIFLISNPEMSRLNKLFRGRTGPTNILSFNEPVNFPHPELSKGSKLLGEICLAPSYIKARDEDIVRLTIHGVLHLAGYTHSQEHGRIKMEKKEKEILHEIA